MLPKGLILNYDPDRDFLAKLATVNAQLERATDPETRALLKRRRANLSVSHYRTTGQISPLLNESDYNVRDGKIVRRDNE